jgi:hypothetical protein
MLSSAIHTMMARSQGKERNSCARSPADQDRIAAQQRDDRRGEDRREDPRTGGSPINEAIASP